MPLFEAELAAFAHAVEASPTKQIVLILDRARWHSTQRLHVPDHVHVLFLPPYSPEEQPAEYLWPLTNTVLVNCHFASIEELEDVQATRCVALRACRDLVNSTTLFHWWPPRLEKTTSAEVNWVLGAEMSFEPVGRSGRVPGGVFGATGWMSHHPALAITMRIAVPWIVLPSADLLYSLTLSACSSTLQLILLKCVFGNLRP
jgi:transposase